MSKPTNILRLLVVGDTHLDDKVPMSRKDDYLQAGIDELYECFELARERECNALLHLGDVFHTMDPKGICRNAVMSVFQNDPLGRSWDFRKFVTLGNHDVNHNPHKLPHSALGTLVRAGAVEFVDECPELGLGFAHFNPTIEENLRDGLMQQRQSVIWAAHANILVTPNPHLNHFVMFNHLPVNPECKLVLAGHIHYGMEHRRADGVHFINPGSVCRNKASREDMEKKPKVLYLEYTLDGSFMEAEYIYLQSSRPMADVFKVEEVQARRDQRQDTKNYIKQIHQMHMSFGAQDKYERLNASAKTKGVPQDVLAMVMEELRKVNERRAAG